MIHGGSGGIVSVIDRRLRASWYDLHLVGRDEERLDVVARELGATSTLGDVNDSSLFARATQDAGAVLDA